MTPAEREFARMLARSAIGDELRGAERSITRVVLEEVFASLGEADRRDLERMCADAGSKALYAFIAPFAEAVEAFARAHPRLAVQQDDFPGATPTPQAGEWIRASDGDTPRGVWHLFGGDIRLRVEGRTSSTFAEARCGRTLPVAGAARTGALERVTGDAPAPACRVCRRAAHRSMLRARRGAS